MFNATDAANWSLHSAKICFIVGAKMCRFYRKQKILVNIYSVTVFDRIMIVLNKLLALYMDRAMAS